MIPHFSIDGSWEGDSGAFGPSVLRGLVRNAISEVGYLYEKLYYDSSKRMNLDRECMSPSEDLLCALNAELMHLRALKVDPERARIVDLLAEYEQVIANDRELRSLHLDPRRLSQRGLMTIARREQMLLKFNRRRAPSILAQLAALVPLYEKHEAFTFQGKPIAFLLADCAGRAARSTKAPHAIPRHQMACRSEHGCAVPELLQPRTMLGTSSNADSVPRRVCSYAQASIPQSFRQFPKIVGRRPDDRRQQLSGIIPPTPVKIPNRTRQSVALNTPDLSEDSGDDTLVCEIDSHTSSKERLIMSSCDKHDTQNLSSPLAGLNIP